MMMMMLRMRMRRTEDGGKPLAVATPPLQASCKVHETYLKVASGGRTVACTDSVTARAGDAAVDWQWTGSGAR